MVSGSQNISAVLCCAVLCCAVLCRAVFCCVHWTQQGTQQQTRALGPQHRLICQWQTMLTALLHIK